VSDSERRSGRTKVEQVVDFAQLELLEMEDALMVSKYSRTLLFSAIMLRDMWILLQLCFKWPMLPQILISRNDRRRRRSG
jgi:hypothetical protein